MHRLVDTPWRQNFLHIYKNTHFKHTKWVNLHSSSFFLLFVAKSRARHENLALGTRFVACVARQRPICEFYRCAGWRGPKKSSQRLWNAWSGKFPSPRKRWPQSIVLRRADSNQLKLIGFCVCTRDKRANREQQLSVHVGLSVCLCVDLLIELTRLIGFWTLFWAQNGMGKA